MDEKLLPGHLQRTWPWLAVAAPRGAGGRRASALRLGLRGEKRRISPGISPTVRGGIKPGDFSRIFGGFTLNHGGVHMVASNMGVS